MHKGGYAVLWMVICCLFFISPSQASVNSVINLALNKSVTADSAVSSASNAVDGESYSGAWLSANTAADHWLVVDLGASYLIDTVVVVRGNSSSLKNYDIQYWTGSSWQTAATVTNSAYSSSDFTDILRFTPVTTSQVRIYDITQVQTSLREIQIFRYDSQPVYVNQSGYDLNKAKRFTAPNAENGATFTITLASNTTTLYSGTITDNVGDFSTFNPASTGPYVVRVSGSAGNGVSVPFNIGAYWIQQVSLEPAINFMINSRCRNGNASTIGPGSGCTNGVAWRDSHQFSFELPNLIAMYAANPDAYSVARMPLQATYSGLRYTLPASTPEIVRLIYWGVEVYLQGDINHTLLKEQLAYFVYAYPGLLDAYIPEAVYTEARDMLFSTWGNTVRDRWNWYDITHTADLFQTYTVMGTGKGSFPPGHSIIPNLMMYEVALREGRSDAQNYFDAAYNNAQYIINNWLPTDVTVTKGQRMSEPVLMVSLAYFYDRYPSLVPSGLVNYVNTWATTMIARSDNMWDFRRYSDTLWIIPTYNEPGNVAGFPASAIAAAQVATNGTESDLRLLAYSHVDNVFGRNPSGRHFSANAPRDFEGVELGWYQEYAGGAGDLANVRGVLDASPKEASYPYNPVADQGYTEGWVSFNSAWNIALAYLALDDTSIAAFRDSYVTPSNHVFIGNNLQVELTAPLNLDYSNVETGDVHIRTSGGDALILIATETSSNALNFRASVAVASGTVNTDDAVLQVSAGDDIFISYGYGYWGECVTVRALQSGSTPPTQVADCFAQQNTEAFSITPPVVTVEGIIIDNTDSAFVTMVGSWSTSTFESSYIGSNYLHDGNTGKGTKSITFTPDIPTPGEYAVYLYWNSSANRADNVPVSVVSTSGTDTLTVDQRYNGGAWFYIGTYNFDDGTGGSVTLSNTGTSEYVIADAVRFVPVNLIIDNVDTAFVSVTGSWTTSTYESARIGADYLHDGNTGKGTKSVTFTPDIPSDGTYSVYLYWNSSSNRAINVPVSITHAEGTASHTLNQQQNGGQWVLLGDYDFDAGTSGTVTISNTGTNGYVIVDAIRLSPAVSGIMGLSSMSSSIEPINQNTITAIANPLTISMEGALIAENEIAWSITVNNVNGSILLTDILPDELRYTRIEGLNAIVNTEGQSVTILLNDVSGDVTLSLITQLNYAVPFVANTVCTEASCTSAEVAFITALPQTGETPLWAQRLRQLMNK